MKRFMLVLTLALSMVLILGACGNNADDDKVDDSKANEEQEQGNEEEASEETVTNIIAGAPMQDGIYTLEESDFDDNGWKVAIEITVEDGKITASNYNYTDADGQLKTEDEDYQEMMKEKTGVGPQEFVKQLNDGLVATQDAQLVDIVTGATHSAEAFVNYAQQLIQAAQNGNTETIIINNAAALQDGEYSLVEKNIGSTDWKATAKIVVDGGKIIESDYNYLNADGDLKTDDDGYQEFMTEKVGVGPQDFIPTLNDALVEKQNPADVDIVTGATHSTHTFKLYAGQLINAAQKGNTEQIVVDNFVYEKEE